MYVNERVTWDAVTRLRDVADPNEGADETNCIRICCLMVCMGK